MRENAKFGTMRTIQNLYSTDCHWCIKINTAFNSKTIPFDHTSQRTTRERKQMRRELKTETARENKRKTNMEIKMIKKREMTEGG